MFVRRLHSFCFDKLSRLFHVCALYASLNSYYRITISGMRLSLLHLLTLTRKKNTGTYMSKIVSIAIECRNETTTYSTNGDDDDDDLTTNKCMKISTKTTAAPTDSGGHCCCVRLVIIINLRSLRRLEQIKA